MRSTLSRIPTSVECLPFFSYSYTGSKLGFYRTIHYDNTFGSRDSENKDGHQVNQKDQHYKDVVAESTEDMENIQRAAHHISEEDLEQDELGMKDLHHLHHKHEHKPTWKEAEEIMRKRNENTPNIPSGSKNKK